jgi:hypothetical protein
MKPYYYVIRHKPSGKLYAGSQYGKNSDPNNLWETYFTSSKLVKELIKKDGVDSFEIEYVDCRPDAREYEQKYLMTMYEKYGREEFLERFLNRNLSPGILLTEESIAKANGPEKRKKCSESAKNLLKKGKHNFQHCVNPSTLEHNRKKSSERMQGNNYGSLREMTDELREKLAEKSKGNTNVRGTKWWTDGTVMRRSGECPGEGFRLGTIKGK